MNKKILIIISIISFLLLDTTVVYTKKEKNEELRIVYISYLEYLNNFYGNSKSINQTKIHKMIDNIKELKFNCIMLHVSPFSDAIYNSKYFPYSYTLTGEEGKNPGFDFLEYFIKIAHQKDIQIHAWINPYRIRQDQNIEKINHKNPAYELIDTSHIMSDKSGIYYNPASEISKSLIIKQVKEIINNYSIDGIHFDDYFYVQDSIDKKEYDNYIKNGGDLSLKEFRLYHTNDLIKRVYKVIKDIDDNIIFSIAPDGNINNNYLYHYADVKTWLKSREYVDMIMPQIYYGFENQYKPFEKTLSEWQSLTVNKNIKIVPVLAFYKTGNIDNQAGRGKNEWISNNDIIKRQIEYIREEKINGIALFRYDFLFYTKYLNDVSIIELDNVKKIV